jgi:excisionase family DNA binding protein
MSERMMKEALIAVNEIEMEVPVKKSTIRSWIQQNRLPVVRLGRRVFVKRETIEKILTEGLDSVDTSKK